MIGAYDKQSHDICRKRLKVQCVKKGIRNKTETKQEQEHTIKVLILEQHFLEQKVPNRGPLRTGGGGVTWLKTF